MANFFFFRVLNSASKLHKCVFLFLEKTGIFNCQHPPRGVYWWLLKNFQKAPFGGSAGAFFFVARSSLLRSIELIIRKLSEAIKKGKALLKPLCFVFFCKTVGLGAVFFFFFWKLFSFCKMVLLGFWPLVIFSQAELQLGFLKVGQLGPGLLGEDRCFHGT